MLFAQTDVKVATLEHARHLLEEARREAHTVVLTNGVFDLLHMGHVRYLQEARALGDVLAVGLNDDASVRRLKGERRPLIPLRERAVVLAALECVDLVVPFGEDTAETLLAELKPDLYVKGGDYDVAAAPGQPGHLPEAQVVAGYGGRVAILSYLDGCSTSALIETIVRRYA
jgi:rfaE bifunctional protein nucleotidyltransferase chain/domain